MALGIAVYTHCNADARDKLRNGTLDHEDLLALQRSVPEEMP